MPKKLPVLLLIDGNNLAHFLYPDLLPGQKMTEEISQRLVSHLASYIRQHAERVSIELYLDRSPAAGRDPLSLLHIFAAEYPLSADDVLIERFWYHHLVEQPYLVITNDEDLLEEVENAQGNALRVSDFVRRAGMINPVFREPGELTRLERVNEKKGKGGARQSLRTSVYLRITSKEGLVPSDAGWSAREKRILPAGTVVNASAQPPPSATREAAESRSTAQEPHAGEENQLELLPQVPLPSTREPSPAFEGPFYQVDFDRWPLAEGIRFLKQSFCPAHRKEYRDLLAAVDYENPKTADVRAVAELLLFACGDEPDFARRGSMMDRVRLALLQAGGDLLSAAEIAPRTGLKPEGLQGKIRQKAGYWVSILGPGSEQ
jgi:hypothetical protein